jgi:hypothetical protein
VLSTVNFIKRNATHCVSIFPHPCTCSLLPCTFSNISIHESASWQAADSTLLCSVTGLWGSLPVLWVLNILLLDQGNDRSIEEMFYRFIQHAFFCNYVAIINANWKILYMALIVKRKGLLCLQKKDVYRCFWQYYLIVFKLIKNNLWTVTSWFILRSHFSFFIFYFFLQIN